MIPFGPKEYLLDSQDETGEVWSQIQAELHPQEVVNVEDQGPQEVVATTMMAPAKIGRDRAATVAPQVMPKRSYQSLRFQKAHPFSK